MTTFIIIINNDGNDKKSLLAAFFGVYRIRDTAPQNSPDDAASSSLRSHRINENVFNITQDPYTSVTVAIAMRCVSFRHLMRVRVYVYMSFIPALGPALRRHNKRIPNLNVSMYATLSRSSIASRARKLNFRFGSHSFICEIFFAKIRKFPDYQTN